MILEVVKYGHPALWKKGAKIEKITPAIEQLIDDMFDTMYDARGVGLAAQQIGQALQLTVLDVREATDRPSSIELDGKPADIEDMMPMVLINPEIKPAPDAKAVTGPEGCLSFPEIFADISRPEFVDVTALDRHGKQIKFRCGGLLARAVQHEKDHLDGVLFIHRMDSKTKNELQPELDELQTNTKAELAKEKKKGR